jgi:uncharacterized membrane protein SpoIIM required for sporulation
MGIRDTYIVLGNMVSMWVGVVGGILLGDVWLYRLCPFVMNNLTPLRMLFMILLRNIAFSLMVFLISYSVLLAGLILFVEGLYVGFMTPFVARSLMVIVPLLPHGVFEVLGYSLIALAGVRYHGNGDYVRVLVIGFVLIIAAALIESFVSVQIARHLLGKELCDIVNT